MKKSQFEDLIAKQLTDVAAPWGAIERGALALSEFPEGGDTYAALQSLEVQGRARRVLVAKVCELCGGRSGLVVCFAKGPGPVVNSP